MPAGGLATKVLFGLRPSANCTAANACGAKLGGARVPDVEAVGDVGSDGAEECPPAAMTEAVIRGRAWFDADSLAGAPCARLGMPEL